MAFAAYDCLDRLLLTLTVIVPGSLGNHVSVCSMRAVTSTKPLHNGVARWIREVCAKGEIVSCADAFAEFVFEIKSVVGVTSVDENLCTIDDKLCRSVVSKSVHEGHPLFGPYCEIPIKPAPCE